MVGAMESWFVETMAERKAVKLIVWTVLWKAERMAEHPVGTTADSMAALMEYQTVD